MLRSVEALAALKHKYWGSFFLDPKDVKKCKSGGKLEL